MATHGTNLKSAAAEPAPELHPLGAMFRSLRHRDFAYFWTGNFLSNIGTWMQNLALGWLVLEITNSPFLLGLNGFLGTAPSLVFSLPGGAIADRLNRRNLMIVTQTIMMVLALILAVLTSFRIVRIREILIISFLTGLASALNNPAYQAIVPDLVTREDLTNAIALNSAQFNMSRAIGPMLAGLTLGSLGAAGCFYLNTVSFLALIIALLAIRIPTRAVAEGGSIWATMVEGIRFVSRNRMIVLLLSVPAMLSWLGLPFVVLMPVFARDLIHVGPAGLGYLMAGAGIGAVVSALTLASQAHIKRRRQFILGCAATFSLGLILLARMTAFWWSFLLLIILGGTMVGALALTNSTLQAISPPEYRGRIMSMYNLAVIGISPLGSLQAGAVAEAWGVRTALALGGAVCLAYFLILFTVLTRTRQPAEVGIRGNS
jgi:MFS family permease